MADVYRAGFTGGSTEESTEWMADQAKDATKICVPFAGIGRAMVNMAKAGAEVWSWDTQHYTRCVVDGVFNATEVETNVDQIRYKKGYAYEHPPYKHIDERCCGFIDWVATNGTLYDKSCLASAMIRSTLMARMMHWHTNIEGLYTKFQRQFEYNREWLNRPGVFHHTEGNFFDSLEDLDQEFDLVHIDPPKVINYSDVYSLHFKTLNAALTQGEGPTLPKWSRRNAMGYYRRCMQIKAKKTVFMYTSGVFPDVEAVEKMLREHGEIQNTYTFNHQGRTDYGYLIVR
jgi:hypothetical protein